MTDHPDTLAAIAQRIERKAENITDRRWLVNEVRRLRALVAHDQQDPAGERRFDLAVDIVLNSGLLSPHMDDFWAFIDGEIDEDEARKRLPS